MLYMDKIKKYLINRKKLKAMWLLSKVQYLLACIQSSDNDNGRLWANMIGDCIDLRNKILNKMFK